MFGVSKVYYFQAVFRLSNYRRVTDKNLGIEL